MNRQILTGASRGRSVAVIGLTVILGGAALGSAEEVAVNIKPPPPSNVPPPAKRAPAQAPLPPSNFNLPPAFAILNKRTLFSRNGVAATPTGAAMSPEATMAVRGIVSDEKSFMVFIEDTAAHHTLQVRPGDAVAGGKVGKICLDDFSFESGGASRKICVGQNLLGAAVPAAMPAPPQPAPGTQPEGKPDESKNPKAKKEPVFEIGPNGQRVRNIVAERAG